MLSTLASISHDSSPSRHLSPTEIPLLQGQDDDLLVPHVITRSRGYSPALQVAGVRHTAKQKLRGKGKEKENVSIEKPKKCSRPINLDDDEELPHKTKRGRPQGTNNYSVGDTNMLLDCVQDKLPLGQRGWMAVTTRFNKWAAQSGRPERKDRKSVV